MREDQNTGTAEMRAVGQELLHLGARCLQAGKEWLNERTHDMAQHFNPNEQRDREESDFGGAQRRGMAPRWDEEGDDMQSRYQGARDYGRQRSGYRYTGESEAAMGGRHREEHWERDQQSPYHSRGSQEEHDDSGRRYRQGWQSSGQDETRQRRAPYAAGTRGDWERDELSTYGRQGSRGGGRGAYAGNYQAGQYGDDWQRDEPGQDMYGNRQEWGGQEWSGYRSGGYRELSADQPRRYGSSMGREERYSGNQGGFRGRGPKNYSRSDERISEDLNEKLMDADDVDPGEISVRVKDGVVTLEGTVEQRWIKHRIEDIAEACSGVKDIENHIRVERGASHPERMTDLGASASRRSTSAPSAAKTGGTPGSGSAGSDPGTTGTAAH